MNQKFGFQNEDVSDFCKFSHILKNMRLIHQLVDDLVLWFLRRKTRDNNIPFGNGNF